MDSFFKSFRALAFALPLYLIALHFQNMISLRYSGESFAMGLALLDYAIRWATYLLFAYGFARLLNISHNFIGFAVVFNWVKVWLVIVPLPILALGAYGLLDDSIYGILSLVLFLYMVSVQIFTIYLALGARLIEASAIFLAIFLFDKFVQAALN
ncbi:MAG: hypothetical protein PVF65_06815 [Sphingomonadales bacterium]